MRRRLFRSFGWGVGLILPGAMGLILYSAGITEGRKATSIASIQTFHTGPTIEQVRELAELVTTRVEVADVQESRVAGYLGGMRVALIVKGDFLLGVDLSAARFGGMDQATHTVTLRLPAPRVTSARVDHERTRVVAVSETGIWTIVPGDAGLRARIIDQAFREAQRTVAGVAADPKWIDQSRQQAQRVLATFFRATGWGVTVKWE